MGDDSAESELRSRPAGVDRGAIMYKEHDLSKLEELKRLCEEVE